MNSKPWYTSKTIWFNILSLAASILALAQAQYPELAFIAFTNGVVNIILRYLTTAQPISSPSDTTKPQ